jgi:hypothetical protein
MKSRYIDQYELPFNDIDEIITYLNDNFQHFIDNPSTLLTKLFDEIKFGYYCVLSSIKTRRSLCDDLPTVENAFDILVNSDIKEYSRNEVMIGKKMISNIDVNYLIDKYNTKYNIEDTDSVYSINSVDDDDKVKCITNQQLEIELDKHYNIGKINKPIDDVIRRQTNIENNIVVLKTNQLLCVCGIPYTKDHLSRHRKSKHHQEYVLSHGGCEV